ncbi:MAG TPA: hypothetical protein VN688_24385 [Gemmataceae bacterium]|nr:hypothetical protein [Gemmataceae bacterium]
MPSKPPPPRLPLSQPSRGWLLASENRPATPLVNWSAIVASASLAFALLVSIVAWIITHPHKAAEPVTPPLSLAAVTPVSHVNVEPVAETPRIPSAPPTVVIPAVHHVDRQDVLLNHVPRNEEPPPLLPPPPQQQQAKEPDRSTPSSPSAGETYGTQVLFLNNPVAAAERARREKKMLFVMHISGNFEESCFT